MEARRWSLLLAGLAALALGARYQTANFVVDAATPELAREIGEAAERYRDELAQLWLGKTFPQWSRPCPITAKIGPRIGAGGVTTFVFERGEVFNWNMTVQGSRERVLDSVLPHEITHTVFATHFRQPLPRWADEGACTTVEHPSERNKQNEMLHQFLTTNRGIPFSVMFKLKEYPADMLPLYAQGHSLATYLIQLGGRRKFIAYLEEGLKVGDWSAVTQSHYGFQGLGHLQGSWLEWVRQGSPLHEPPAGHQPAEKLVSATQLSRPEPNLLYRAANNEPQQLLHPEARPSATSTSGRPGPVPTATHGRPSRTSSSQRGDPFAAVDRAGPNLAPIEASVSSPRATEPARLTAAVPHAQRVWPDQGWRPPRPRGQRDERVTRQGPPVESMAMPPVVSRTGSLGAQGDEWEGPSAPPAQPEPLPGDDAWLPADAHGQVRTASAAEFPEGVRFDSQPRGGIKRR